MNDTSGTWHPPVNASPGRTDSALGTAERPAVEAADHNETRDALNPVPTALKKNCQYVASARPQ